MIEMIERIGWNEALHPRAGGRFAPKGTATQGKSATQGGRARGGHAHDSSEKLSYNGRTGAGYGKKGGDGRVHGLQSELNRLGFKDSSGKPLKLDGKLGPRTTAAIKHAQKALGLKVDGIATPGLLAKLKGSKKTTARKTHAPRKSVPVGMSKPSPAKTAKAAPVRKRPTFVKQANPPPTARKAGPMSKNVSRSFNPSQDRDRDGQWSDGIPGPGADALKLAGRIKLGPGEKFGGSAKIGDGYGDATAVIARVDTSAGPVIRFGVVAPEDAGKWQGAQRGRTVELDAAGAAQLREVLTRAKADGKRSVTEHRSLPGSDVEADIASGVISGSRWGDVGWNLTREEGQDGRGEWNLALDPAVGPGLRDNFNITKNAVADKLGKALSDLLGTAGGA